MVELTSSGLFREQFPILNQKTYLASHSLGAMCRESKEALGQYADDWAQGGIEAWDGPFFQAITDFQTLIGGLLNFPPESVCPMLNVTRGMAGIASCFDFRKERNRVILTELEFTTSFAFWQRQSDLGAEIVVVPTPDGVTIPFENIQAELDERTALVVCSHAFFRSSALCCNLESLSQEVHKFGGLLLLDVYQTLGAVPLDAAKCGVDIVVGGCHKWLCGGAGAGFLAVDPERLTELHPRLSGWFGLAEPFSYENQLSQGEHHPTALRFLAGTPAVPSLYAARPALKMITDLGVDTIRERSMALTESLRLDLLEKGFTVSSPADPSKRNGMLCIQVEQGAIVVDKLSRKGIVTDYRPDCGLRVSPHFYTNSEDLNQFSESLASIRR